MNAIKNFFINQIPNLFLWMTFVVITGGVTYFMLPTEPAVPYPFVICAITAIVIIYFKPNILINAILLFIFGFCYANGFTKSINTPDIYSNKYNINITGTVYKIDYTDKAARIFMEIPANKINRDFDAHTTANIRLSLKPEITPPTLGNTIIAKASLFKPNTPFAPNAFDYSRWAYFNGLSATGYLIEYDTINHNTGNDYIQNIRESIHKTANSFLVDTLLLGYKNAVPKSDNQIWSATGVGHIWSISGYHMSLAAVMLFFVFYNIFRLIPAITKRFPARYPALILSLSGLLFYLFLSGTDVATIRSFFMAALVIVAFLFHRNVLSLRNVSIAMILLFLINPHFIMQPGFQLSFAAVFGMVYFFKDNKFIKRNPSQKIIHWFMILAKTSFIAFIFTAPFIASHFNSLTIYSLVGNLILIPLFSILIMPFVILGAIASFFGFHWFLNIANDIYIFCLNVGAHISDLPFAILQMPNMPFCALAFITLGFFCLIFIRNTPDKFILQHANKLLFGIFLSTGLLMITTNQKPVVYSTPDNKLIAFKENDGLHFNKSKSSAHFFAFETWKKMNFQNPESVNKRIKCKQDSCFYKSDKFNLVYIKNFMALYNNIEYFCKDDNTDFIVSPFEINSKFCNHKILNGGFVIYKDGRVQKTNTNRIWHK